MEILDAMKVVDLMKNRDTLLDMRSCCESHSMSGWSFMVKDRKIPIPAEVKHIFIEAIEKSLDHSTSKREKI